MCFFSTALFLLIVICCGTGIVNALAVWRELNTRREQEYHARVRTAAGELILRNGTKNFGGEDSTEQKAPFQEGGMTCVLI
ncbi:hypothetical protein ACVQHJ_20420 [Escherichia coli]|uniref:hypothetical protein n=1 Tax=Escherichia coli TaxID=562 RepID=UPI0010E41C30|nr:hypothetical protein BvCmsKKNP002_00046 [Escherichia coli]